MGETSTNPMKNSILSLLVAVGLIGSASAQTASPTPTRGGTGGTGGLIGTGGSAGNGGSGALGGVGGNGELRIENGEWGVVNIINTEKTFSWRDATNPRIINHCWEVTYMVATPNLPFLPSLDYSCMLY